MGDLTNLLTGETVDEVELMRTMDQRLNLGCGAWPLSYWMNLDQDPETGAEIIGDAMEYLQACDDGEYQEIYAGHFLEHLTRPEAQALLVECLRVLVPGGKLGVLVPDTREIVRRYLAQSVDAVEYPEGVWRPIKDLDQVCAMFLYGTVQPSHHQWSYDLDSLALAMSAAGFVGLREIDRYRDPRIGRADWYQCGIDGWKPEEEG